MLETARFGLLIFFHFSVKRSHSHHFPPSTREIVGSLDVMISCHMTRQGWERATVGKDVVYIMMVLWVPWSTPWTSSRVYKRGDLRGSRGSLPCLLSHLIVFTIFFLLVMPSLSEKVSMGEVSTTLLPLLYILEVIPKEGCLPLVIPDNEQGKYALVLLCIDPYARHFDFLANELPYVLIRENVWSLAREFCIHFEVHLMVPHEANRHLALPTRYDVVHTM